MVSNRNKSRPSSVGVKTKEASVPISSLPDKLLVKIFFHVVSHRRTNQGLFLITHTCHRWRAVALSTPRLWNIIRLSSERPQLNAPLVKAFLRRSKNLPFSLFASVDEWNAWMTIVPVVFPQAHRITRLEIMRFDMARTTNLFSGPQKPVFPRLVRLMLASPLSVHYLPTPGQFPRLRMLCLVNVVIPWTSDVFTPLVTLRLGLIPGFSVNKLDNFLDMLVRCMRLRSLEISHMLESVFGSCPQCKIGSPVRVVALLPALRTLVIDDDPAYCTRLLAHLSLASTTDVETYNNNVDVIAQQRPTPLPKSTAPLHDGRGSSLPNLLDVRSLRVYLDKPAYRLTASEDCEYEKDVAPIRPIVDLQLPTPTSESETVHVASALRECTIPFSAARIMSLRVVGSLGELDEAQWRAVLSPLPYLEHLSVQEVAGTALLRALGSRAGGALCPRLKRLEVDLGGEYRFRRTSAWAIASALASRVIRGMILGALVLEGNDEAQPEEGFVRLLASMGCSVTINGKSYEGLGEPGDKSGSDED